MSGYRRPVTDADRAEAAEARQATLDKLHAQLSDGILALNDPRAWQAWLKFSSQFHRYSFGNSLLIMLQDPQATHVAGYQAFKAMGRQVRRGETGIKVLAPITRREPRLDDGGRPVRDDWSGWGRYKSANTPTREKTTWPTAAQRTMASAWSPSPRTPASTGRSRSAPPWRAARSSAPPPPPPKRPARV